MAVSRQHRPLQQHPQIDFPPDKEVHFFDIDISALVELSSAARVFTPLSKYPFVSWDLAMVVPDSVGAGNITSSILAESFPLVKDAEIFDVYRGKPIDEGYKSVALSITYHSDEQTLDDDTVSKVHEKVIKLIVDKFDGQLREV